MSKDKEGRPLQKHTLNLFEGDWERLGDLFPQTDTSRLVRHLVRDLIDRTKGERPNVDIDLEG